MLAKDFAFQSKRLRYRGIREEDADAIVEWRNNPDNYKNFLNAKPLTKEEHLAWFQKYLEDVTRYDFIIEDSNGDSIGTCGLSNITEKACEISYMIGALGARGKGYATEAIEALSKMAFDNLGVSFIEARILSHNEASIRAAEKCRYQEYERVFRLPRSSRNKQESS